MDAALELDRPLDDLTDLLAHDEALAVGQAYDGVRRGLDGFDKAGIEYEALAVEFRKLYHPLIPRAPGHLYYGQFIPVVSATAQRVNRELPG